MSLSAKQETAAQLVADDRLTDEKIAEQVGVDRRTLARWKTEDEFITRVAEIFEAWKKRVMNRGIAIKEKRIARQDATWERLQQVVTLRAARHALEIDSAPLTALADDEDEKDKNPEEPTPEEARTGELVRIVTYLRDGAKRVEWAVDTGLLGELRALEKQAAQELGQWTEKKELSGPEGGPVVVVLRGVSMDDL